MSDATTAVNDTPMYEFEEVYVAQIVRTKKSGLKLYFSNEALIDAKFQATIRDGNLLVEQVEPNQAGVIVRHDSHSNHAMVTFHTMYGDRYVADVHISPTVANGRFSWVIPNIPHLQDNRVRRMAYRWTRPLRYTAPESLSRVAEPPPEPEPQPEPEMQPAPSAPQEQYGRGYLEKAIRVLRRIEATSDYRLERGEDGLLYFIAKIRIG